jgi:hypothetical protein
MYFTMYAKFSFILNKSKINLLSLGLSGASTAGRPRRPASGPDGVGGVIAKPNVMCRGEVGPEDREDESVENGKCFPSLRGRGQVSPNHQII